MNREECIKSKCEHNEYWKLVRHKLKMWKKDNGLTCKCVIHHRDDTEETLKYNSEHYELWGFNEDGTFEYGKYVIFMTSAEHVSYHKTGEKNHNYGKKFSDEHRAKLSAAHQGKKPSDETCAKLSVANQGKKRSDETRGKISAAQQGIKVLYTTYKNNGGILQWNAFRKALSNGEITFEMRPITVYVNGGLL